MAQARGLDGVGTGATGYALALASSQGHAVTVLPGFFKEHKDALAQAGLDLGEAPPSTSCF